jgi:hypothetical protein
VVPLRYDHQKSAPSCGTDFWWRRFRAASLVEAIDLNRHGGSVNRRYLFSKNTRDSIANFYWFSDIYTQGVGTRTLELRFVLRSFDLLCVPLPCLRMAKG